jgi:threonylcarbamoyladenosine tRNA methylthiotransferase MtaB
LSLQSGCTETLKRMNRRYTTEEFKEVVRILRKNYNDVILTTDIIVGFPGETDEEFNKTYEFLKQVAFYKMHVFKYSQRKGTKAAVMENQIDGNIKEKRSKMLINLSNENQLKYNKNYVGKIVDVLFEEKDSEGYYKGHTKNYILVKTKSDKNLENKVVSVLIEKAHEEFITGTTKL